MSTYVRTVTEEQINLRLPNVIAVQSLTLAVPAVAMLLGSKGQRSRSTGHKGSKSVLASGGFISTYMATHLLHRCRPAFQMSAF